MKQISFIITAILISLNCHAMEKTTKSFDTDVDRRVTRCIKCQLCDEAKLAKFPFLEDTHHWTVFINMLTPFRCSLYLLPKRHVTSFTELTSKELEEYRILLNKWKPVMSKETTLTAFNTASEALPSEHFCVECAVRSSSDSGTINTLLQDAAITRKPRILFEKLLQISEPSIGEETLSEKLHFSDDPTKLASYQFFQEKVHS